jgi:SnoaL-like domain
MTSDDVLCRLQRLEDRAELRELVDRYSLATDDSDWETLREMFTAGVTMAGVTGRDEVIEMLRSIRDTYGRTIHTVTGQVLEFGDDNRASGVVSGRSELAIAGQTVMCAMRYLDTYERVDGRWRFARRRLRFSYALPWEEMHEAMTADKTIRLPETGAPLPGSGRGAS